VERLRRPLADAGDGTMGFGIHSPFATRHFTSQPTAPLGSIILGRT
jgi:hypothetical protein